MVDCIFEMVMFLVVLICSPSENTYIYIRTVDTWSIINFKNIYNSRYVAFLPKHELKVCIALSTGFLSLAKLFDSSSPSILILGYNNICYKQYVYDGSFENMRHKIYQDDVAAF